MPTYEVTHPEAHTPSITPVLRRNRRYSVLKRAVDVAGAAVGLVVTLPLWLLATCLIRMADPGPVLLAQWRVRHGGRLFRMYKFRTMYRDAERRTGAVLARRGDPRVIPWCRWMRRTHVDELPQLWNVLRGDMSLVGPRPERPEVAHAIQAHLRAFAHRAVIKPGLTGLAQVRGGYANDLAGHRLKLHYDMLYIRTRSLKTDLKLIFASLLKLWDRRAC